MLTQSTYVDYVRMQQKFGQMAVVHQHKEDDCCKGLVTDTCAFGVSRLPSTYLAAFRSLPNSKGSACTVEYLSMSQHPSTAKASIPEKGLMLTPCAQCRSSICLLTMFLELLNHLPKREGVEQGG